VFAVVEGRAPTRRWERRSTVTGRGDRSCP
jgi:hypothetical protein